ncbi:hypothetical protein FJY63_12930, partial [Candidatus Sumerlaeota bacterium]|nr:hypothetical protein [Candidatus Sumerlaeota bacterium]
MSKIKRWMMLSVTVFAFVFAGGFPSAIARSNRDLAKLERVGELTNQGMEAYKRNDIEKAASLWREALLIDPDNQRLQIFLNQIASELEKAKVARQGRESAERQQKEATLRLDEKVALIETKEGTKLRDFLNTLSFVTGMNFFVTHGADLPIVAKFEDKALREILDAITQPYSLAWAVKGNVVTLSPVWRTRTWR